MARRGKLGTPSSEIPQMPNWAPSGSMDAHELESIQKGVQSESLDERARESRKHTREEVASKPVTAVSSNKAPKSASISAQPAVGAPRGTSIEGSAQYGAPRGTGLEGDANGMIDLEQEALGFQAQADTRVIDGASDGESAPPPNRLCGTNPNARKKPQRCSLCGRVGHKKPCCPGIMPRPVVADRPEVARIFPSLPTAGPGADAWMNYIKHSFEGKEYRSHPHDDPDFGVWSHFAFPSDGSKILNLNSGRLLGGSGSKATSYPRLEVRPKGQMGRTLLVHRSVAFLYGAPNKSPFQMSLDLAVDHIIENNSGNYAAANLQFLGMADNIRKWHQHQAKLKENKAAVPLPQTQTPQTQDSDEDAEFDEE